MTLGVSKHIPEFVIKTSKSLTWDNILLNSNIDTNPCKKCQNVSILKQDCLDLYLTNFDMPAVSPTKGEIPVVLTNAEHNEVTIMRHGKCRSQMLGVQRNVYLCVFLSAPKKMYSAIDICMAHWTGWSYTRGSSLQNGVWWFDHAITCTRVTIATLWFCDSDYGRHIQTITLTSYVHQFN